jgi:hypothetical protein
MFSCDSDVSKTSFLCQDDDFARHKRDIKIR